MKVAMALVTQTQMTASAYDPYAGIADEGNPVADRVVNQPLVKAGICLTL